MIKINRKMNGEILGLSVFLGKETIIKFVTDKTNFIEVHKTVRENGVFLEFEPIKAIREGKK